MNCLEASFSKDLGSFSLRISFELGEEIAALFGPSGAGKSLTLKILAGLDRPKEGRIVLNGRVLYDSASSVFVKACQRRIGLVFQELALFPHMTALENVAYGLKGPNKWKIARQWLDRVKLEGLYDRMPNQLSGGQRQRVALARALAPKPDLLLLDEPFSALDGPMRRALRRELKKLSLESQTPTIYVTHDIEDVCSLASRVFLIRDGKTLASIDVDKLWDPHAQESIWHSLGWGTLIHGKIEEDGGSLYFKWDKGRLKVSCSRHLIGEASVFIHPNHVKLLYPDVPVDPELEANVIEGKIIEKIEINGSVRLYIKGSGIEWHAEYPGDSYLMLEIKEGQNVLFSIAPSKISLLTPCFNSVS
mgnify:FL=1